MEGDGGAGNTRAQESPAFSGQRADDLRCPGKSQAGQMGSLESKIEGQLLDRDKRRRSPGQGELEAEWIEVSTSIRFLDPRAQHTSSPAYCPVHTPSVVARILAVED